MKQVTMLALIALFLGGALTATAKTVTSPGGQRQRKIRRWCGRAGCSC
jgi:hypothetical protein